MGLYQSRERENAFFIYLHGTIVARVKIDSVRTLDSLLFHLKFCIQFNYSQSNYTLYPTVSNPTIHSLQLYP
jgi:hypothetical protein